MSTPTHALVVVVAVVVVVMVVCVPEAVATKGRVRREQGKPGTDSSTLPGSGDPDTDPTTTTTEVVPSCTGTDDGECSALVNSECNKDENVCKCTPPYNVLDIKNSYCGKTSYLDQKCTYTSECSSGDELSVCSPEKICVCGEGYVVDNLPELGDACIATKNKAGPGTVDTAMIGVLAGLALMFVIICVVLRLFSKARFRENRSIFNTPNPRLMNASLFKDIDVSGRRGSAMSAVSATGSNHGHTGPSAGANKTPSPVRENKKDETTVAIETVD